MYICTVLHAYTYVHLFMYIYMYIIDTQAVCNHYKSSHKPQHPACFLILRIELPEVHDILRVCRKPFRLAPRRTQIRQYTLRP